eukprot:CAMPEP_0116018578 /NCGR_PEP_ID=MMETSP0321-20121206/8728_1 /TAXON_ID=163516 /ORGANISM="Leptocylindrus danicus var. danicus, Strain B650" /LENGTH=592 /DNA_ID=CAMNT_0003488991 /DNA_START=588 /DNA_END=2366 /DNA_ORIENTATION=-
MIAEQVARNQAKRQEALMMSSFQKEIQSLSKFSTSHEYAKHTSREMKIAKQNSDIIKREEAKIAKTRGIIAAAKIQESASLSKWNIENKQKQKRARVRNSAIEREKRLIARYEEKKKNIHKLPKNETEQQHPNSNHQESRSCILSVPTSANEYFAKDDSVDYVHWFREHIENSHGTSTTSTTSEEYNNNDFAFPAPCLKSAEGNSGNYRSNECAQNNFNECSSVNSSLSDDLPQTPPPVEAINLNNPIMEFKYPSDQSYNPKNPTIAKHSEEIEISRAVLVEMYDSSIKSKVLGEGSLSPKNGVPEIDVLNLEAMVSNSNDQEQSSYIKSPSSHHENISFPLTPPRSETQTSRGISSNKTSPVTISSELSKSTSRKDLFMASPMRFPSGTRDKMRRLGVLMDRIDKTNAIFSPSVDRLSASAFGEAFDDSRNINNDDRMLNAEKENMLKSSKCFSQDSNHITRTQEKLKKLNSVVHRLSENHQSMHVLLEKDSQQLELCTTNIERLLSYGQDNEPEDISAPLKCGESTREEQTRIDFSCDNHLDASNNSKLDESQFLFSLVEQYVREQIPESSDVGGTPASACLSLCGGIRR